MAVVKVKAHDGSDIVFVDQIIGSGGMKDVYLSKDKSYVVAFFRKPQDYLARERLNDITGKFRDNIYSTPEAEYWRKVFCWPTKTLEWNNMLGLVAPTYPKHYFFEHGSSNNDSLSIRGKEKEGKWFASALHQGQNLDPRERGRWVDYLRICLHIARAARRLHLAGLAHSDLSYKNVLVDPKTASACIIDIDGLVVPGKFPPDVIGTPDFVAPEVMRTLRQKQGDPGKALPRRETDQHALAVLIYLYLFYRHPLKGRQVCDPDDAARDDELSMGEKALFIEHPQNSSNRPNRRWLEANEGPRKVQIILPYANPDDLPHTVAGPYLAREFERSFVDGLHNPTRRPSAADYETALMKTIDLLLDCSNPNCRQRFFVYNNSLKPACPFCRTPYGKSVPVFDLYTNRGGGRYMADNQRLVGYHNQSLFKWHMNATFVPNEKLKDVDRQPVGYIAWHQDRWKLVNQGMPALKDVTNGRIVPVGQGIELANGLQLQLDDQPSGRMVNVQIAQ